MKEKKKKINSNNDIMFGFSCSLIVLFFIIFAVGVFWFRLYKGLLTITPFVLFIFFGIITDKIDRVNKAPLRMFFAMLSIVSLAWFFIDICIMLVRLILIWPWVLIPLIIAFALLLMIDYWVFSPKPWFIEDPPKAEEDIDQE